MAGKQDRDYHITVLTDDPSLFDLLPEVGPYEAQMVNRTMTPPDVYRKEGKEGRSPLSDSGNVGGRVLPETYDPTDPFE